MANTLAAPGSLDALPPLRRSADSRAGSLDITEVSQSGSSVMALVGDLCTATVPRFAEALECLCGTRPHRITLQLAQLHWCCCAGVSAIITAHVRQHARGGRLVLVAPPPQLRRLLALTGLDHYLDIR